jgi:hypothetical protein
LDFGLCENVRADEKLTTFLELETAIHEFAVDVTLQCTATMESVSLCTRMNC